MRSQQSEHIGQVFGIDLSSERLSSADTEIGGVRTVTGGISEVSPTTNGVASRLVTNVVIRLTGCLILELEGYEKQRVALAT